MKQLPHLQNAGVGGGCTTKWELLDRVVLFSLDSTPLPSIWAKIEASHCRGLSIRSLCALVTTGPFKSYLSMNPSRATPRGQRKIYRFRLGTHLSKFLFNSQSEVEKKTRHLPSVTLTGMLLDRRSGPHSQGARTKD